MPKDKGEFDCLWYGLFKDEGFELVTPGSKAAFKEFYVCWFTDEQDAAHTFDWAHNSCHSDDLNELPFI